MLNATFRPIRAWPGPPTKDRESSGRFKAGLTSTYNLLEFELGQLGAREIIVQLDLEHRDIRNDGWPRSEARPRSPGVIVSFETQTGTLTFACDRYNRWEANLRAIGLTLEALRAVDRYGATKAGQQYAGFRAIPAQTGATLSTEEAAAVVAGYSQVSAARVLSSSGNARAAVRVAAARTHPDRNEGAAGHFQRLQTAKAVLEAHFGVPL